MWHDARANDRGRQLRVWVIDDDADFRSLLRDTAPVWLEVITSASADEARRAAQRELGRVDLALVDVHLPVGVEPRIRREGPDLVRWLHAQGHRMPAVLTSSRPQPPSTRPLPILGFLRKPVDLDRFHRFLGAYAELFELGRTPPRDCPEGGLHE